jgi:hypothetical protein
VAGAKEALFVSATTPAEPVIVFNAASWRRTQAVSVLVDVGSAVDSAAGGSGACRGSQWPFALVSDEEGRGVSAQWLASVEEVAAARGVAEAAEAADGADGTTGVPVGSRAGNDANAASPSDWILWNSVPPYSWSPKSLKFIHCSSSSDLLYERE